MGFMDASSVSRQLMQGANTFNRRSGEQVSISTGQRIADGFVAETKAIEKSANFEKSQGGVDALQALMNTMSTVRKFQSQTVQNKSETTAVTKTTEDTNNANQVGSVQSLTTATANSQSRGAMNVSNELADIISRVEESLKRAKEGVDAAGRKESSARVTLSVDMGSTATGGADLAGVGTTSANQADSVQLQTTANTQNQGVTTDRATSQRNQALKSFQANLNRLGSQTKTAQEAEVNSNSVKFAENFANSLANGTSNVSDTKVKEEADKFYQQTMAYTQLQQVGVAKIGTANQATPQVLSLFG